MLKSLFPAIEWGSIRAVGFDLDGTLYDEFDFVLQAYTRVARRLAQACGTDSSRIRQRLLARWLEKGSSYAHIFEEVLADAGQPPHAWPAIIEGCVQDYRETAPTLQLSARVQFLLECFQQHGDLFLFTDGQVQTQRAKIEALGLTRWFAPGAIAITGGGPGLVKPSCASLQTLAILPRLQPASAVVYFGNREVDREFAAGAGFHFVMVDCMLPRF